MSKPTSNVATSDRSPFPAPRGQADSPRIASGTMRRRSGKLPMSANECHAPTTTRSRVRARIRMIHWPGIVKTCRNGCSPP